MACSEEAVQLVRVHLQVAGELEDAVVVMTAGDMRASPDQAITDLRDRAEELLRGRPLLRLNYVNGAAVACTLTATCIDAALASCSLSAAGFLVLQVLVLPDEELLEPLLPEERGAAPPMAPAPEAAASHNKMPCPVQRERAEMGRLEVHRTVTCDGCGQSPIFGKRFKCIRCDDYDLCERCWKRNRADAFLHEHVWKGDWVGVSSKTLVPVRADITDAEVELVQSYYAKAGAGLRVHEGIICDGCDAGPIVGTRFHCTTVPNYDLCAACYVHRARVSPHANEPFKEMGTDCPDLLGALLGALAAEDPAKSMAMPVVERPPAQVAPTRAAAALKALAAGLNEDLCAAALEALLAHPDERLRVAAAAAVESAAAATEPDPVTGRPAPAVGRPTSATDASTATEDQPMPAEEASKPVPELPPALVLDKPARTADKSVMAAAEASPTATEPTLAEEPAAELAVGEASRLAPEVPVLPAERLAILSAMVVSSAQLVLGVEATEDAFRRGDVTREFGDVLQPLGLRTCRAYCCGRMVLPISPKDVAVPAEAKLTLLNDGSLPWPEASRLSLIAGDPFGLPELSLGPAQPGEAAEVILDLSVPLKPSPAVIRSAWSMNDAATGTSFGPVVFFEVLWIKQ